MLFISSISATLITLFYLEKRGKIAVNTAVLIVILLAFCSWGVIEMINEITKTFL